MRDWAQFKRLYLRVASITGSLVQATQVSDPDVIEAICSIPPQPDEWKVKPPDWWRFTDVLHRLTDIADQLIASRAHGDDVKFYPRPVSPAAKERRRRVEALQDGSIEAARRRNAARRGLDTIKY